MDKQHQGCGEVVKQSSEYLHPYSLWNHNWGLYQGKLFGIFFSQGLFSRFLLHFVFIFRKWYLEISLQMQ